MSPSLRLLSLALLASAVATPVRSQTACPTPPAGSLPLQLEVVRNDEPTNLLAAFTQAADGELFAAPAELRAIGLKAADGCRVLRLADLPGVAARYDDLAQRLYVTARPDAIIPLLISLHAHGRQTPLSRDAGALLNYSLSVGAADGRDGRSHAASGGFEARVFGPLGLAATGAAVEVRHGRARAVRLDSSWTWSDPSAAVTWRGGDSISGGFSWTRPIRFAGVQLRRDFETRPDLITTAAPVLSASAAAPSTLEVMLGSSVLLSRRVSAGPIEVSDLPILQAQGAARLVLRDAQGHVQEVSASYFATPELLRPGTFDFSAEAGFARRNFGLRSGDYDPSPAAQGSLRYGLLAAATIQGHAEVGAGLVNGGGGVVTPVGDLGAISVAAAVSRYHGAAGALVALGVDGRLSGATVSLQAQRRLGPYRDLAAVTAPTSSWRWEGRTLWQAPQSLVQAAVSSPLPLRLFDRYGELPTATLAIGAADDGRTRRATVNGALRARVGERLNLQMSGYAMSSGGRADRGLFIGLSLPLGPRLEAAAGVERAGDHSSAYGEVRRPEQLAPGDLAWRLRAERVDGDAGVQADAVYRSRLGRLSGELSKTASGLQGAAELDGALVWMGRPMIAADRLEQAFAVVDVGAPGVEVRQQNRAIGRSDRRGLLLAANLNAYEGNELDIDLEGMPLNYAAPVSQVQVNPAAGAGVHARFGVRKAALQAEVVIALADGAYPPPGAPAALNGEATDSVVGYDGRLFLAGLQAANTIVLDLGDAGQCHAALSVNPEAPVHDLHAVCR